MEAGFITLSLTAGALLSVQAGANAQLAKATGSPFTATTLQLGVGALLLLAAAAPSGGLQPLALLPQAAWWHVVGGAASALYVLAAILLFPRIGAVVSVGLFIAGQITASSLIDAFGLLGVPATGWRLGMISGGALVLAGAGLIVLAQNRAGGETALPPLGWVILALLAGAVLPVQGAVNALLRTDLAGAALAVGAVSFIVATVSMAAILLLVVALQGAPVPKRAGLSAMPWWGWLGGFAGAAYVTTVFTAIPVIGAAATVGFTVAGQQVASALVDRFGWFRLPQRPPSAARLLGVAVLLLGVGVIKLT
jgi:transporter family-2 protein